VETALVEEGEIARVVVLPGTVEPIRTVGVNAQVSGALLEVPVEEGDRVLEGQVMARLDDRELQAQLRSAEAAYEVAEAAFQRARQLRERQVITQPEYEADRTAFEAARAQLDQIRTRVGFTEVRSPIGGVVTAKLVQSGDVIGVQGRLLDVAEVDTMVVRVSVSELDVVEIAEGDPVAVELDARPGETLQAAVRRVFPAADPATRLVPVEVALSDADRGRARPGFLARVTFQLDPKPDAKLVPASAIVSRGGGEGVYVVADSTVVLRTVTPGLTSEGRIEIVEGLAVGDRVVTLGANLLRDGAKIRDVTGGQGDGADTVARRGEGTSPAPGTAP
jgi:cobalt-zinc-cadmium efflux system membrane fusion protein